DSLTYVCNTGNHEIRVFDSTYDDPVDYWGGTQGSGDGQFSHPNAIAVNSAGLVVYVVDSENHRVQVFDTNGNFLNKFGSEGTGPGQFTSPVKIAIDQSDNVYVMDRSNRRIEVFDANGNYLRQIGGPGTGNGLFSRPSDLAFGPGCGTLYVADLGNNLIQKFVQA
ncbi:MAG: 6-bladed beta-propeller, partial [Dehalococcoidia bacterium]